MNPIDNTMALVERLLRQVADGDGSTDPIPIAYESEDFVPDDVDTYYRIQYVFDTPEDPVFPAGYHRERISFQVFVCGTAGQGNKRAYQNAINIREQFKKGSHFNENGTPIHILTTPMIGGTVIINDRVIVPVVIPLVVEVYNYK